MSEPILLLRVETGKDWGTGMYEKMSILSRKRFQQLGLALDFRLDILILLLRDYSGVSITG